MPVRCDVVIPAHDEERLLGNCLRAVLAPDDRLSLRVIVVANGCTDGTADVVRSLLPSRDHDLRLVELPSAGKWRALNAAAPHLRGVPVVHLDADTVLLPGTLAALAEELTRATGPLLAAPPPVLARPRRRLTRGFAAVWTQLPAVAGQVTGNGVYAVNAAGRARWTDFPPVIADDAYVRSLFAPQETVVLPTGGFVLVLPEGRDLIAVLRRWHRGNRELATADPSPGLRANARFLATRRDLWRHAPAFLLVRATVALTARLPHPPWPRATRA
jgi:glycosyltransferase involved in cell wall biosynthesis